MKPTTEILARINQDSETSKDEVFTRLFRYMLRSDVYYIAYKHLYANKGAATKGVNNDTADGFSADKIKQIINALSNGTYSPTPVRRVYIDKGNGKKRPLGIPTFTDKLVQEVLRMVLEAIYEPVFLDNSHGFRPQRSCHTALQYASRNFCGSRWFIEGDIKGCFDNINHSKLLNILGQKIKDARLITLISKFLKAGYVEDWKYNNTYSGTPQGGIISPILANIYLHELDKFVIGVKAEFDRPLANKTTPAYNNATWKAVVAKKAIAKATPEEKPLRIKEYRKARHTQLTTPCLQHIDKKLAYMRYADDFLISINGNREDCLFIKAKLAEFISSTLKMELSEEKTLITHSSEKARFLGYDIRIRRNGTIRSWGNTTKRTINNRTELTVPLNDKIHKFLFDKGIVEQTDKGTMFPIHRPSIIRSTELEIVATYNAELRGICNYYSMACNFHKLNYFAYLMEYSCLKTLAAKHNSTIGKMKKAFRDGHGSWGIPYETKTEKKRMYFARYADCGKSASPSDAIAKPIYSLSSTTFEKRLKANKCELCGCTDSQHYEIHHVNKVKNLQGKAVWEQLMIAKQRKTLVVCRSCHKHIHGQ